MSLLIIKEGTYTSDPALEMLQPVFPDQTLENTMRGEMKNFTV